MMRAVAEARKALEVSPKRPFAITVTAPVGVGKTVGTMWFAARFRRGRCFLITSPFHHALMQPYSHVTTLWRGRPRRAAFPPALYVVGHERFCIDPKRKALIAAGYPPSRVCATCPYRSPATAAREAGINAKEVRRVVFKALRELKSSQGLVAPRCVIDALSEYSPVFNEARATDDVIIVAGKRIRVCHEYALRNVRLYMNTMVLAPHSAAMKGPLLGRVARAGRIAGEGAIWVVDEYDALLFEPESLPYVSSDACSLIAQRLRNMGYYAGGEWIDSVCREAMPRLDPFTILGERKGFTKDIRVSIEDTPEELWEAIRELSSSRREEDRELARFLVALARSVELLRDGIRVVVKYDKGVGSPATFDTIARRLFLDYPEVARVLLSATPANPGEIYVVRYADDSDETLVSPKLLTIAGVSARRQTAIPAVMLEPMRVAMPAVYVEDLEPIELRAMLVRCSIGLALWSTGYGVYVPKEVLGDFVPVLESVSEAAGAGRSMVRAARRALDKRVDLLVGFPPQRISKHFIDRGMTEYISVIDTATIVTKAMGGEEQRVIHIDAAVRLFATIVRFLEEKGIRPSFVKADTTCMIVATSGASALAAAATMINIVPEGFTGVLGPDVDPNTLRLGMAIADMALSLAEEDGNDEEERKRRSRKREERLTLVPSSKAAEKKLESDIGLFRSSEETFLITYLRSPFSRGREVVFRKRERKSTDTAILMGCGYRLPMLVTSRTDISPDDTTPVSVDVGPFVARHTRLDIVEAANTIVQTVGRAIRAGAITLVMPAEAVKVINAAPPWFKRRVRIVALHRAPISLAIESAVEKFVRALAREVLVVSRRIEIKAP